MRGILTFQLGQMEFNRLNEVNEPKGSARRWGQAEGGQTRLKWREASNATCWSKPVVKGRASNWWLASQARCFNKKFSFVRDRSAEHHD